MWRGRDLDEEPLWRSAAVVKRHDPRMMGTTVSQGRTRQSRRCSDIRRMGSDGTVRRGARVGRQHRAYLGGGAERYLPPLVVLRRSSCLLPEPTHSDICWRTRVDGGRVCRRDRQAMSRNGRRRTTRGAGRYKNAPGGESPLLVLEVRLDALVVAVNAVSVWEPV
jgi:hypothetical protein